MTETYSEDYLIFYAAYPRKEGKRDGQKAWNGMPLGAKQAALADVEKRTRHKAWSSNLKVVPLPGTYLRGCRWEDSWFDTHKSSSEAGQQKPNSGPVDFVPRDNLGEYSNWQAFANRLFFRYIHVSGGLSADQLTQAIAVKNRVVSQNSAAFDEESELGNRKEAVWTFANLLIDHFDELTGLSLKGRILSEGRHEPDGTYTEDRETRPEAGHS